MNQDTSSNETLRGGILSHFRFAVVATTAWSSAYVAELTELTYHLMFLLGVVASGLIVVNFVNGQS